MMNDTACLATALAFASTPIDSSSHSSSHSSSSASRAVPATMSPIHESEKDEEAPAVIEVDLEDRDEINRIGWKRLSLVLLVEAIALGCLGLPKSFSTLGLFAGLVCTVGIGLICIYTSWIIGEVKLRHPHIHHYADAGRLLGGRFMYEVISAMFCLQLVFVVGSHCLTGTIAFSFMDNTNMCEIIFGWLTAFALFVVALPPSIAGMAWLGYVDFASIMAAVIFTIVTTGLEESKRPGGLAASTWSWWPEEDLTFAKAFVALCNILFAYSFAIAQFTFMDEMHTVKDFPKAIWTLGIVQIVVYSCTGLLIYIFAGKTVSSPALLSENETYTKVAFILAIPVIFISGSINTTVIGKYLLERFAKTPELRHVKTMKAFGIWTSMVAGLTVLAWLIAESIPFFDDLLAVSSSLFTSGFSFFFPAWMWWTILRDRNESLLTRKNMMHLVACVCCSVIGLIIFFGGTYASISDILSRYEHGDIRRPFSCGNLNDNKKVQ